MKYFFGKIGVLIFLSSLLYANSSFAFTDKGKVRLSETKLRPHSLSWQLSICSQTIQYEYSWHQNQSIVLFGGFGLSAAKRSIIEQDYKPSLVGFGFLDDYSMYYSWIYGMMYRVYIFRWIETQYKFEGYNNSGVFIGAKFRGTSDLKIPVKDGPDLRYDPVWKYGIVLGLNNEFGSNGKFYFNGQLGLGRQYNYNHTESIFMPFGSILFGIHLFQKATGIE